MLPVILPLRDSRATSFAHFPAGSAEPSEPADLSPPSAPTFPTQPEAQTCGAAAARPFGVFSPSLPADWVSLHDLKHTLQRKWATLVIALERCRAESLAN
jgi:hypothetical protein